MPEDGNDWVVVFTTGDQVEAEVVRGLLSTSAIPVVVEARGLKSMSFVFGSAATGELRLKVPPDMADLARDLLAARPEFEED